MRIRSSLVFLVAAALAVGPAASAVEGGPPIADRSHRQLYADATGSLTLSRATDGRVDFVGVPAGSRVDNPAVTAETGAAAAARSHLSRYGSVLGLGTAGSQLVDGTVTRSVTGHDLVRYQQQVGGVPVLGSGVVVNLRSDRELGSILATISDSSAVAAPLVSEQDAAASVRSRIANRRDAGFRVLDQGRWLFDPAVFGAPSDLGARTVWRFEVTNDAELRRQVLVDDRSGRVLMDLDLINYVDRVVCDQANVPVAAESLCTSGFARTEASGASGVADVNSAFVLSGAVSTYYQQVAGLDLTNALGINVGGVKKLASTVRLCFTNTTCPYANAFWNGQQMYYGQGYAGADDVVGHEMTHGVIDQNSELFYWYQSGAINESLADIMGEIVDHRNTLVASDATWLLGEDLAIGAIRNMSNPPAFGDPDRMTSPNYTRDASLFDSGGVHTNSGVGNKTAYLISQGGSFNGRTITGIDGADTGLTKTAKLYYAVIQGLTSGSDYANLADVLDQSCQDLVGTSGFTASNCTNVRKATQATQLRTTPPAAAQPADASDRCPAGTAKRVLFDGETGTPGSAFTRPATWVRAPGTVPEPGTASNYSISPNATSGRDSWFGLNARTTRADSLVLASAVSLPANQKSYLWFQHWRIFEYAPAGPIYYDGGTVEVDDVGGAAGPQAAESLPWVNGPSNQLNSIPRKAFGGDSTGWIASKLNLSSYAGKSVKPQFTLRSDSVGQIYGWFLDDIRIYTCDPTVITGKTPKIGGKAKVGRKLTAKPGAWTPTGLTFRYQWFRGSKKISGAKAKNKTYRVTKADRGKKIKVKVTGKKFRYTSVSKTSKPTRKVT